MPARGKMIKTSVSLSQSNLKYVDKEAKRRRRSRSFLIQEIVEKRARELQKKATHKDNNDDE